MSDDGASWDHGRAVVGGVPQFTSVSALELVRRCARQWWYRYCSDQPRPPETAQQLRGTSMHALTANYLRTGTKVLPSLIIGGLHALPPPTSALLVEHPIHSANVVDSLLTADGIPVIGKIDYVHADCKNYGASDVEDSVDPPGTVEVGDHKFPGSMKYAAMAVQLPETVQMSGYGEWVFRAFPDARHVRLSHNYYPPKGLAKKVTIRVGRDVVARAWEKSDGLGQLLRLAARESTVERVTANTDACDDYGGCPYADVCSAKMTQGIRGKLDTLLGRTGASRVFAAVNHTQGDQHVSIMSKVGVVPTAAQTITNPTATPTAWGGSQPTTPQPMITVSPAWGPPPQVPGSPAISPEVAAQIAKLKADEEQAAQTRARAEMFGAIDLIEASGGGMPQLSGQAAAAYAARCADRGHPIPLTPGGALAGSGPLGMLPMSDPAALVALAKTLSNPEAAQALANDLRARAQQTAQPQTNVQRQDPPLSITPANTGGWSTLPPDAPPSMPGAPTQPPPAVPAGDISAVTAEKPKRGKKPKSDATTVVAATTPPTDTTSGDAEFGAVILLVDSTPIDAEHEALEPHVDVILRALEREFNVPDVRYSPDNSKLAYNGWKAAISATIRDPQWQLPPGLYTYRARGSELAEIVADAMRSVCARTGGWWARGNA